MFRDLGCIAEGADNSRARCLLSEACLRHGSSALPKGGLQSPSLSNGRSPWAEQPLIGTPSRDVVKVRLTDSIEKLIALVQNEVLDVASVKTLVSDESVETTRSRDNDVRAGVLVLQSLGICLLGSTAVEDRSADVGQIFAEPRVLVLDLVRKLSRVAEHDHADLPSYGLELLKRADDENSGFT